jgi:hypothetical protein
MPKFSIKDLLIATGYIAAGIFLVHFSISACDRLAHHRSPNPELDLTLMICFWFAGGLSIGVGVLTPFRHPVIGGCLGVIIQFVIGFVIVLQFAGGR